MNDRLKERYLNDVRFHRIVNMFVAHALEAEISPDELKDAMEVSAEKLRYELRCKTCGFSVGHHIGCPETPRATA